MPTYDYQCRSCGAVTEVIHSMLEDGPSVCERCGGSLRRVFYPTGIIFKGSGFYSTDSRSSSSSASSSGGGGEGGGKKEVDAAPAASSPSGSDGASGSTSSSGGGGASSSGKASKPSGSTGGAD